MEEATFGRAFSSGMAATDCALRAILRPGDHVVMPDDSYGGTFRIIDKVFTQWGIDYTAVALSDLDAVRDAITPKTKLIIVAVFVALLSIAGFVAAKLEAIEPGGSCENSSQRDSCSGPGAAVCRSSPHT